MVLLMFFGGFLIFWSILAIIFKKMGFMEGVDEEIKEYNNKIKEKNQIND
jgi:hypothetical protein